MDDFSTFPRVAILTAIEVEHSAILEHLSDIKRQTGPKTGTVFSIGKFNASEVTWAVAVHQTHAGQAQASIETSEIVSLFDPHILFFVGVAGGFPEVVKVGDIVVPTEVNYYESQKITDNGPSFRPKQHHPSRRLLQAAEQEKKDGIWLNRLPTGRPNDVDIYFEPIVSGEKVVASSKGKWWKNVRRRFTKAVAVEMEGHGFYLAQHHHDIPALMVRGVSDLLDNKNSSTDLSDDERQKKASLHAAAFSFEILNNLDASWIEEKIGKNKNLVNMEITIEAPRKKIKNILRAIADLCEDDEIVFKEAREGSIILSIDVRGDNARLIKSLWKGRLTIRILDYNITSINIEKEVRLSIDEEKFLRILETIQKMGEIERTNALKYLIDFSEHQKKWRLAAKLVYEITESIKSRHARHRRSVLKTLRLQRKLYESIMMFKENYGIGVGDYAVIRYILEKGLEVYHKNDKHFSGFSDRGVKPMQIIYGMPTYQFENVIEIMQREGIRTFSQTFRWLLVIGFKSVGESYYKQMALDLDR